MVRVWLWWRRGVGGRCVCVCVCVWMCGCGGVYNVYIECFS